MLEQREKHFENMYGRNPFILVPVNSSVILGTLRRRFSLT